MEYAKYSSILLEEELNLNASQLVNT